MNDGQWLSLPLVGDKAIPWKQLIQKDDLRIAIATDQAQAIGFWLYPCLFENVIDRLP